mgnify:CR=1 FL=1
MSAMKLIKQMLNVDPASRPTFNDVLKSDFIMAEQQFLNKWRIECEKEAQQAELEKAKGGNEIVDKEDS